MLLVGNLLLQVCVEGHQAVLHLWVILDDLLQHKYLCTFGMTVVQKPRFWVLLELGPNPHPISRFNNRYRRITFVHRKVKDFLKNVYQYSNSETR